MYSYENTVKYSLDSLPFIRDIIYRDSVGSTNVLAEELARTGRGEWTVVVADSQSNGRGRQGRVWFSPSRINIYTSFILRPEISYEYFPAISLLAGMVVAIVIEHFVNMPAELKWPNDVMVEDKKISGVLLALGTDLNNKSYIVVGIGINVNSDTKEYPDYITTSSTSMRLLTNKVFDRSSVLNYLYTVFHEWYNMYCVHNGFNGIREQFMRRFKMTGKQVNILNGTEKLSGTVEDIDKYGRLVLKSNNNETIAVKSGDVHLI